MKYILTSLLFWGCSVATAQIMLPVYQGVFSKNSISQAPIISSGLVINLDANNAASYAGSGSTWFDISGKGHHGTLNNTVFTTASGVSYFNFSSARVDAPIPKSASMTFSAWAKSSSFTNSMLFNTGDDGRGPDLFFYSGYTYWNVWDATASPLSFSSASIDKLWHNYAIVNDATTGAVLYFDGIAVGTASYRASNYTPNLYIGAAGPNNDYGWVGGIASFQAYNRALTAAEVLQNFNAVKGNYELQTVQIGTQTWMTNNADVDTYQNGDVIPEVTNAAAWNSLTTGAWCYYANSTANGTVYGKLYNWYAVHDPRKMAPIGWHVPADAEYATLQTYLGGSTIAGGKLMSTGTSLWPASNASSTNSSGFSGLPGGYRLPNGGFNSGANWAVFWASDDNGGNPFDWQLRSNNAAFNHYPDAKTFGFSVRFIKDGTLTNGLVLNLDASNSASYPGSGTSWNDLSGNNNNALLNGAVFSAASGASYFTCSSNCISTNITKSASMTFSVWAKSSNFSASTMLFNIGTNVAGGGPDLLFYQNNIYWNTYDGVASPFTFSPTADIANWHNYTVVNDAASNAKLYIDGVFKATALYRPNTAPTSLTIGGGGGSGNLWIGGIASFQAYNLVLTAAEVLQNFNGLKGRFGY